MKKRLIMLGLGLAVVGTGMVINKLRKRNNEEELNEVEEIIENEVEEIVVDNEEDTLNEELNENNMELCNLVKFHVNITKVLLGIVTIPVIAIKEIFINGAFLITCIFDKNLYKRMKEDN
jgi:hypothetical protein